MSSLWDEIKDLFKTDKQLEQERQEKINSALEKEADVSKKLAELEKQYKDSLPKDEEIDFDKIVKIAGMNISIVTSARTDAEARALLTKFNMPFRK